MTTDPTSPDREDPGGTHRKALGWIKDPDLAELYRSLVFPAQPSRVPGTGPVPPTQQGTVL